MTLVNAAARAGLNVASGSTTAVMIVGMSTVCSVQAARTPAGKLRLDSTIGTMSSRR